MPNKFSMAARICHCERSVATARRKVAAMHSSRLPRSFLARNCKGLVIRGQNSEFKICCLR